MQGEIPGWILGSNRTLCSTQPQLTQHLSFWTSRLLWWEELILTTRGIGHRLARMLTREVCSQNQDLWFRGRIRNIIACQNQQQKEGWWRKGWLNRKSSSILLKGSMIVKFTEGRQLRPRLQVTEQDPRVMLCIIPDHLCSTAVLRFQSSISKGVQILREVDCSCHGWLTTDRTRVDIF